MPVRSYGRRRRGTRRLIHLEADQPSLERGFTVEKNEQRVVAASVPT